MTREEKQKAIDALKISAPVRAITQEEFYDYVQAINQIMDWLEQEPRTGHWVDWDDGFSACECSECKHAEFTKSKYCPNCGIKMDNPLEV